MYCDNDIRVHNNNNNINVTFLYGVFNFDSSHDALFYFVTWISLIFIQSEIWLTLYACTVVSMMLIVFRQRLHWLSFTHSYTYSGGVYTKRTRFTSDKWNLMCRFKRFYILKPMSWGNWGELTRLTSLSLRVNVTINDRARAQTKSYIS